MPLVLKRRNGESIELDGPGVVTKHGDSRLRIDAPASTKVRRTELPPIGVSLNTPGRDIEVLQALILAREDGESVSLDGPGIVTQLDGRLMVEAPLTTMVQWQEPYTICSCQIRKVDRYYPRPKI